MWDLISPFLPIASVASTLYGSKQQEKMAKKARKQTKKDTERFRKQQQQDYETYKQDYETYKQEVNPPKEILDTRFAEAKDYITGSAPQARRRLENRLASRGIRGRGAVSPIMAQEQAIQDALNDAYFNIYTDYNVPPPPPAPPAPPQMTTIPTPSTSQLFGTNMAQQMNYLLPLWWMNSDNR